MVKVSSAYELVTPELVVLISMLAPHALAMERVSSRRSARTPLRCARPPIFALRSKQRDSLCTVVLLLVFVYRLFMVVVVYLVV